MKNMRKCRACGRRRKPGHEKRAGTPKAYTPQCLTEAAARKQRDAKDEPIEVVEVEETVSVE